jgi:hypothetical protein
MGDHLGVGVGAKCRALFLELIAQFAEVLDDAVVNHRNPVGGMGMRIAFGRSAVGCPAGVTDADVSSKRLTRESGFEIAQFTLGSTTTEPSAFQSGDAGGVIAPIFEPLEGVDEPGCDRLTPENADDSAHASGRLLC